MLGDAPRDWDMTRTVEVDRLSRSTSELPRPCSTSSSSLGAMVTVTVLSSRSFRTSGCRGMVGFLLVPNSHSGYVPNRLVSVVVRETFWETFLPILKKGIERPSMRVTS